MAHKKQREFCDWLGAPRVEIPGEVWINKPVRDFDDCTTGSSREVKIVCPGPDREVASEKKGEMVGVAH